MRNVFAICLMLALTPSLAIAQQSRRGGAGLAPDEPDARLEELFSQLKRTGDQRGGERISNRIRQQWSRSGSASIDLLMQWSQTAIDAQKHDVALDLLDQVVTLAPNYPEGWNRRATVHFVMEDFAKSMSDIVRTLELEPRHFGALGGMAEILKGEGRKEAAIRAYQRLLDVYPAMREAQTELGKLADEVAGQGI